MTEEKGGYPQHVKSPKPETRTHQLKDRNRIPLRKRKLLPWENRRKKKKEEKKGQRISTVNVYVRDKQNTERRRGATIQGEDS